MNFDSKVYRALLHVPCGKVTTYGALAKYINCKSPRAVGQALKRNPNAPKVPCHRVVSATGLGGYNGFLRRKLELLREEGVDGDFKQFLHVFDMALVLMIKVKDSMSERRFPSCQTIFDMKQRLETITGIPAFNQIIKKNNMVLPNEAIMDQIFHNFDVVEVEGISFDYVEKYELPESEYDKRTDSVREFKRRNKLGRFGPQIEYDFKVGDRCSVDGIHGTIRFFGEIMNSLLVGVEYDEPRGKHDGVYKNERIFQSKHMHAVFVNPSRVIVGDFEVQDVDFEI